MGIGKDGYIYKTIKEAMKLNIGRTVMSAYYDKYDIPIKNRNLILRVIFEQDDTIKQLSIYSTEPGFEFIPLNISQDRFNIIIDEIKEICDKKEKRLKELENFSLDILF